jgi:hypothetical protein
MSAWIAALCLAAGPDAAEPQAAVGTLAVALGTVEVKPPGGADFAPAAAGAPLAADTWIRTAAASSASIDLADGSELRVSAGTEVHLIERRKSALKIGAAYWAVKPDGAAAYTIESKFASFHFPNAMLGLSFVNRDPKSEEYRTISRTLTTLQVLDGTVRVVGRKDKQPVSGGWQCTLVDAQLNTPDPSPNFGVATAWVAPLLVARGKQTDEVNMRVELLWNDLGPDARGKACEAALRDLGPWSAPLLAQALKRPGLSTEGERRRAAARVLADVAPPAVAAGLLPLLKDADPELRAAGARALKRLAGQDLGFDEAYWRGTDVAKGAAAWDEHLKKNPIK